MGRNVPGEDFDEFVRSRSGRLLRAAFAMTGDRPAAEDLVQDVMAKVYVRWATIHTSPAVGCSVGTVKSQLSRGLVRLRAALATGHQGDAACGGDVVRRATS